MRVFAGPNGSGKSTVISAVRNYKVGKSSIDFGIYINADDLVQELKKGDFTFSTYAVSADQQEFLDIILDSGLINKEFPKAIFLKCYTLADNRIDLKIKEELLIERFAQALAHFLRKKLLLEKKKFSFETVFSHTSKLDIMREAVEAGYKVYLYFVATDSPEINKERVLIRTLKGGHNVPSEKIEKRYYKSLELLFDAAQLTYQTFFYDNSKNEPNLFTNFKVINEKKSWKKVSPTEVPLWFIKYYADKVKRIKS